MKYVVYFDEAWRWPLAWPVTVGLSVKLRDFNDNEINDSKQLSPEKRKELSNIIEDLESNWDLIYWVWMASNVEIDNYGIMWAIKKSIIRASIDLFSKIEPHAWSENDAFLYYVDKYVSKFVLDWNWDFWLSKLTDTETVIKWDSKIKMIWLSSIMAKVFHDEYVCRNYWIWSKYEKYGIHQHKWYWTKIHTDSILKYWLSDIHRKTFCKKFL